MIIAGSVAVIVCTMWALSPLPGSSAVPIALSPPKALSNETLEALASIDPNVFASARIWAPPQLNELETPKVLEPPKPFKLQLIAIISEAGALRAAMYDPDTDRIVMLGRGQSLHEYSVTKIESRLVELSDGSSTRQLRLREEPPT